MCYKRRDAYYPAQNKTAAALWGIGQNYLASDEDREAEIALIREELRKFRKDSLSVSYSGENCTLMGTEGETQYQWSLPGALLFAVTVYTTVGYGNIAPKTFWGRLVCIAYALVGIPLTLLFLANLGEMMANIFRLVYSKICCCGCVKDCRKRRAAKLRAESKMNLRNNMQTGGQVVDDQDDDDDDDLDNLSVPLTVTLTVIGCYIFMGALFFSQMENNWDSLQSAYYCFITISTIGFGDVVPGTDDFSSFQGQLMMVCAAVYMIFGMAIMSMAFNLIQEEIVSKFVWISEKLGLAKKDEDEDVNPSEEVLLQNNPPPSFFPPTTHP